jgi:thiol-disulfide isomerase/thioredoxin
MPDFRSLSCVLRLAFTAVVRAGESQTLTPYTERSMSPDFVLEDAEGKVHRLSDYRGKVVALNFWATWCPPCWREMPSMQRLKNQMDDSEFVILAVNVGEDEETVFGFTFALAMASEAGVSVIVVIGKATGCSLPGPRRRWR